MHEPSMNHISVWECCVDRLHFEVGYRTSAARSGCHSTAHLQYPCSKLSTLPSSSVTVL